MNSYGIDTVKQLLPHRDPFLFVDEIVESDGEQFIVGQKHLSPDEFYFKGHFPGNPIMPGVIQVETMAQVAGLLTIESVKKKGLKVTPFMTVINHARFRRVIRPGDTLRIEIKIDYIRGLSGKFRGKILVDGKIASEAEISCVLVSDKQDKTEGKR